VTASPSVTVHVASFNTRSATELCIRSLRRFADHPFELRVGDSGSSDGSVEMLERMAARGWLELETSDEPRVHSYWLDHWLAICEAEYAVFVDSDVQFLRTGWLRQLVDRARTMGAAVVCGEFLPAGSFTEPVGGRHVHGAARPSPWLFLVRVAPVRALGISFGVAVEEPAAVPEGVVLYDVGGRLFQEAVSQGLSWAEMPERYRRRLYQHFGGLSWLPTEGRRGRKKLRDLRRVERRLASARKQDVT
jgi:glycosyltransferase involved in cell wall biosynthesis